MVNEDESTLRYTLVSKDTYEKEDRIKIHGREESFANFNRFLY